MTETPYAGFARRSWRVRARRRWRTVRRVVLRRLGRLPAGDGHIVCAQGHTHWGRCGAAGALVISGGWGKNHVLLGLRAPKVSYPGSWGIPGGGRVSADEPFGTTAYRELAEETGFDLSLLEECVSVSADDHGGWQYQTFVLLTEARPDLTPRDDETVELRWVPEALVHELPLHPSFAEYWRKRSLRPGG